MVKRSKLSIWAITIALCYSAAYGSTLTFDEVPSGTILAGSSFYNDYYRVWFAAPFEAADNTLSTWGPPHSGNNVLVWSSDERDLLPYGGWISFGYVTPAWAQRDEIASLSAYFSTQTDVMVKVTAYHWSAPDVMVPVTSAVIGASGQSWNNEPVEISSPNGPFNTLKFEGVNSPNELLGFSLDDLTITPVPEPSSLLALFAGLISAGVMVCRRR